MIAGCRVETVAFFGDCWYFERIVGVQGGSENITKIYKKLLKMTKNY